MEHLIDLGSFRNYGLRFSKRDKRCVFSSIQIIPLGENIQPSEIFFPVALPYLPTTRAPFFSFRASKSAILTASMSGYFGYNLHENLERANSELLIAMVSVGTFLVAPFRR